MAAWCLCPTPKIGWNEPLAKFGQSILFVEFVYPTGGIENFLLTRVERMALRAYLDLEGVVGQCGFRRKVIAATTFYGDFMVGGVNVGFHRSEFLDSILYNFFAIP